MCLLLMAATEAVGAEIIKNLDFYESLEVEEQANENESNYE